MQNYIIFEIDKGNEVSLSPYNWVKESPFIHKLKWAWSQEERNFSYGVGGYGVGSYGSFSTDTLPLSDKDIADSVGSLIIDTELYTAVNSIAECKTTDKSFYFDIVSQILYINFILLTAPWDYVDISLGVSDGYSNIPFGGGINYDPRIISVPEIEIERDSLYFGKVSFSESSVTLNNIDHYFDTFDQDDVFGKICRIKHSIDNVTYKTLYSGKLDSYSLEGNTIKINMRDARKALETKIPNVTFNKTDYPDINDNLVGEVIPIGYNTVLDSIAYSLNESDVSGTFDFKFCNHAVTSIQEVRVDNSVVTPTATDLTNGEFTLAAADYDKGQTVTIDYTGKNLTNPLDIIKDILLTYTTSLYNNTFFNVSAWDAVTLSVTSEIGLGLIESESIADVIGRISQSILGSFLNDGNGRFNFKVVDNTKQPVLTLYGYDYIEPPILSYKSDEYLSSVKVNYNNMIVSDESPSFVNSSEETALFIKYDTKIEKDFDTLLLSESAASGYSDIILDNFGGIFPNYKLKTKLQTLDLEIEDLIDCQLYLDGENFYNVRLEVLSKIVNYINNEIIILGRFILFTNQFGEISTLPKTAKLLRSLPKPTVIPDYFPNDVIIEFNEIPDYIIDFNITPDYIIEYQE